MINLSWKPFPCTYCSTDTQNFKEGFSQEKV
jgi:hypothetical protein